MSATVRGVSASTMVILLALFTFSAFQQPVSAAFGDVVSWFSAPVQGNGRALAFDGTDLWYTIYQVGDTRIFKTTTTGILLNSFKIYDSGIEVQIGALAWEAPQYLWAGSYMGEGAAAWGKIYKIDVVMRTTVKELNVKWIDDTYGRNWQWGDIDGLAYDPVTNTLWFSADLGRNVYRVNATNGDYLFGFPLMGYNSGLEYKYGEGLWLAIMDYVAPYQTLDPKAWLVQFDSNGNYMNHFPLLYPHPESDKTYFWPEDLAIDSVTFAPKTVMWINEDGPTSHNRIVAWDLAGPPTPPKYYLTITSTTGGTTNPTAGTYEYGFWDTVNVTAIPSFGYLLNRWELDGASAGRTNPIGVWMNTNHTLDAVFYLSSGGGSGGGGAGPRIRNIMW